MIKRKILVFYRVALSSVEVALNLRAAGALPPFFSERKERTRRLIQEGAILEKVFPWVNDITDLSELEKKLYEISKRTTDC